jgi:dihydrofolate synthase/folylpolyglutamate synthase
MRYEEAVARLDTRQPEHMPGPSLERIEVLVNYLDHPELTYPTIHVTGTNGKSTAARAAAVVACATGLTTGLYLSPHLLDVTERFSVCGEDITRRVFADEWQHLQPYLELIDGAGMGEVTYFEAVTGLAFLWFADKPVSLAVFEVGMGGSWDATNVADGKVAVILPVSVDHARYLGERPEDIAVEKAGIIKQGATVILAQQSEPVAEVLLERAAEMGATIAREGLEFGVVHRLPAVRCCTCRGCGVSTTRSSSRCTARTRRRTPRSHLPPSRRSSATSRWTPSLSARPSGR